ncbi:uncharacterized protein Tco025E_09967 [Trypanosoma conorhini]|uniref:Uncharacterized protein n=1 Tax=Trypanosoma conorhini TaxID=83891 RepID=A0A422MQY8_9TRYP|nr:uncharacterized protein Tco025E_09967 [Trypanosoma conorhini]RNE95611.1 hypothetical protein Tco025E_09967 [Trypanosoma conorhini]
MNWISETNTATGTLGVDSLKLSRSSHHCLSNCAGVALLSPRRRRTRRRITLQQVPPKQTSNGCDVPVRRGVRRHSPFPSTPSQLEAVSKEVKRGRKGELESRPWLKPPKRAPAGARNVGMREKQQFTL